MYRLSACAAADGTLRGELGPSEQRGSEAEEARVRAAVAAMLDGEERAGYLLLLAAALVNAPVALALWAAAATLGPGAGGGPLDG